MEQERDGMLILHLSDLHIDAALESIPLRPQKIADALREFSPFHDTCVVAITGDLASRGSKDDYDRAFLFLQELKRAIEEAGFDTGVRYIVVPGNHDCNLGIDPQERLEKIREIRAGGKQANQEEIEKCLCAQTPFFELEAALCGHDITVPSLFWTRELLVDGTQVAFNCFNTAWMSAKRDPQGQLRYPIPQDARGALVSDVCVSLLHHPLWWFHFADRRQLKQLLYTTSDLILTGHEHDPDFMSEPTVEGGEVLSTEGDVLFHPRREVSGFNIVRISCARREWQVSTYRWDDYEKIYRSGDLADWRSFIRNRNLDLLSFPISETHAKELDNIEAPIRHERMPTLRLSDVYVYPDLQEIKSHIDEKTTDISFKSASSLVNMVSEGLVGVVCGEAQAGKSSLLKTLFRALHETGMVPLLLRGAELRQTDPESLQKVLWEAFCRQYDSRLLDRYKQLSPDEKCILIDDLDEMHLTRRLHARVLSRLGDMAGSIVATADEVYLFEPIDETSEPNVLLTRKCYQIMRFRRRPRAELAERWIRMGREEMLEEEEFDGELKQAERVMDRVFERNLVPALPITVLTILRMRETPSVVDIGPGSLSYYFNFLVQDAMLSVAKQVPVDIQYGFLSELAFQMLVRDRGYLTIDELSSLHQTFESEHATLIGIDRLRGSLVAARIIAIQEERVLFRYRYLFYFFAASYLHENLHSRERGDEARKWIRTMSSQLYRADYATITVFLIHFSPDDFIVDQVLEVSAGILANETEVKFEEDVKIFGEWLRIPPKLAAPSTAPRDTRDKRRRTLDAIEEQPSDADVMVRDEATSELHRQHRAAYYTIGVLGQMLLHYPGRLYATDKHKMAKSAYDIGLRAIHSLLGRLINIEPMIRGTRVTIHYGEQKKTYAHSEVLSRAGLRLSLLVIHRIVDSLGSEKLLETYRGLLEKEFRTSYRIVDAAVKLEHAKRVYEDELTLLYESVGNNPWTASLIRLLWMKRLYYYPPDRSVVQRICARFGIPLARAARTRSLGQKTKDT